LRDFDSARERLFIRRLHQSDTPGAINRATMQFRYPQSGVGEMLYIVEVPIDGDLTERMGQMRTWLDHLRCEPGAFRSSTVAGSVVGRVEFLVEAEARAFAQAFGGRVLGAAAA
jgi:hypothetical protein